MKDKRIAPLTRKRFSTEVEFTDGSIDSAGPFDTLEDAQLELARYPRDVALYRNVPQSVFIRHPQ